MLPMIVFAIEQVDFLFCFARAFVDAHSTLSTTSTLSRKRDHMTGRPDLFKCLALA